MAFFNLSVSSIGAKQGDFLFGRKSPKALDNATQALLEQLWKDGAGVFAKELAREVLVETGESVGSLEPLARFTKVLLTFRSASKSDVKRPTLNPRTGKPEGGQRSFRTGFDKGLTAFAFRFKKNRFSFEFTIPVFQFFLHEKGVRGSGTMKGAMERARLKQREFVLREFKRRGQSLWNKWLTTGKVVRSSAGI